MKRTIPIILILIVAGVFVTLAVIRASGEHTMSIERKGTSPFADELITKAENIPPQGNETWWHDTFDDIRLPFAVTKDAIKYYTDLSSDLKNGVGKGIFNVSIKKSAFSYKATADFHDMYINDNQELQNVFVVELHLGWSHYCGSLCALSIYHTRTVIFDSEGNLLQVIGDEEKAVMVS